MRIVHNVKYSDMSAVLDSRRSDISRSRSDRWYGILKMATGLLFVVWLGLIGYFILFPMLPSWQSIRADMKGYEPYSIGYAVTAQFVVSLAPPEYAIEEMAVPILDGGNEVADAMNRSIEYVDPKSVELADLERENTEVMIDSANIFGKVVDGFSQEKMLDGFWHFPKSSVPGKRGNTVIFGHRFHKLPPRTDTFFYLNKVTVGDKIVVTQDDAEFSYTVVEVRVVDKYDESILSQTGDYRLTLITCTPLWTARERLAVIAVQDRVSSVI